MNIDKETIEKIAHLSRLELSEDETIKMKNDLSKILNWVDKLNELNTDDIEPLLSMSDNINTMRDDVVEQHLTHEEALKNAPKKDSDYIRVPKVIE